MKHNQQHKTLISMLLPNSARLLMVLVPCIASPLAFAGGQHYQRGAVPVCLITINSATSATANCTGGEVAGLGNQNVRVRVTLNASVPVTCYNPGKDKYVNGHPTTSVGTAELNYTPDQIKNGSLVLPPISATVNLGVPDVSTACPNRNWSVLLGTATFGPGRYSFEQPVGTELAKLSFSFNTILQ